MIETLATTQGLTGGAALISALALLVHAIRAAIPVVTPALVRLIDAVRDALRARAKSIRLDAETRARTQADHEITTADLRARLDACDEAHRVTQGDLRVAREEIAIERAAREELQTRIDALHAELVEVRRSITAGGHAPPPLPHIHLRKD